MLNDWSATSMSITLANNAQYILSNQTNFWSGDLFGWPLIFFCLATIKWISFVLRSPDLSQVWNFFLVSYQLEMLAKQFFLVILRFGADYLTLETSEGNSQANNAQNLVVD